MGQVSYIGNSIQRWMTHLYILATTWVNVTNMQDKRSVTSVIKQHSGFDTIREVV